MQSPPKDSKPTSTPHIGTKFLFSTPACKLKETKINIQMRIPLRKIITVIKMQVNTTGHSMEIFLLLAAKILLIASSCLSIFHFSQISKRLQAIEKKLEILDLVSGDISQNTNVALEAHDRILASLKEIQETQKPKSTTNWDNLKEAFKGPARITINERD